MKRLIDYDPFTQTETWHEYDAVDKKTRIYYVPRTDADAQLDMCKDMANDEARTKEGIKRDWWHYGFVPNWLMLKWHVEEGVPLFDAEAYNKRLNRPEWSGFKVTHKHHGETDRKIYLGKA